MSCRGTEQNRREIDYITQSDRRTLERLFQGFDLELETEDFYKPQPKSNSRTKPSLNLSIHYPANSRNVYGRKRELKHSKEYLSGSQTITLSGIAGVGKTTLAAKLVEEVKDSFEYIYWRSLNFQSPLPQVVSAILQHLSLDAGDRDLETQVAWLVGFMQQHRCLLIFDNICLVLKDTVAFILFTVK